MRAPATLLAIPLTIGCGCGLLVADVTPDSFALRAAAAAALSLVTAVACCAEDRAQEVTVSVMIGAFLAGLSLGDVSASRAYRPPLAAWFEQAATEARRTAVLRGTIREDAARTMTGVSLVVDVSHVGVAAARGGVRLTIAGSLAGKSLGEWRAGRRITVTASLREPVVYRNPGIPDERRALARSGIALVGSVKSGALVEVTAPGSLADEWASRVRAWARSALSATVGPWSGASAGVATAITIGDRSGLGQDDERRLREAGTYHVIAISGGNIAILTMLLVAGLRCLRVPPRWAAAAAILLLLSYGRVAGPAPSVDRAIAAAVIFLGGRLIEQRGPSINVLAVAAVLGLAASPVAIFDPGFILSFGATLAILVGVPGVMPRSVPRVAIATAVRSARGLLAATLAAEVVLAPVSAALFARITFAGLLLNFLAIPLMTLVQAGSIVTLALYLIDDGAARWGGYVVHLAARGLLGSASLVDVAPWVSRELAPPAWALVAAYYAALAIAVPATRARRVAASIAAALGLVIVLGPHAVSRDGVTRAPEGTVRFAFLDVGQGDATMIVLPDGRALLVDAGGLPAAPLPDPADGPAFDVGERVVSRALRAFGVRSLDTLVITHGDPDHLGGARAVLRSFRPRAVWEGVPVPRHLPLQMLRADASRIGAEWRSVQAGDRLQVAGVDIVALHPPPAEWERQRVRNDDSVVLSVRYGNVGVILPGDIGREGETLAIPRLERLPLVVLKAPHHGSATSSTREFLAAASPRVVIFSAGRDNRFGHPAPVVVERYRAQEARILSTAEDGAVILDTDGEGVLIRGWGSGRTVYLRARGNQ